MITAIEGVIAFTDQLLPLAYDADSSRTRPIARSLFLPYYLP